MCSSSNTNTNITMTTTSAAGALLLDAATRIQISPLSSSSQDEILDRMEREGLREVWQLEYLDSYQWETLGVPMGLVTSIRRCLLEKEISSSSSSRKNTKKNKKCSNNNKNKTTMPEKNNKFGRKCLSPIRDSPEQRKSLPLHKLQEALKTVMKALPDQDILPDEVVVAPPSLARDVSAITVPEEVVDCCVTNNTMPTTMIMKTPSQGNRRRILSSLIDDDEDCLVPPPPPLLEANDDNDNDDDVISDIPPSPALAPEESVDTYFPPTMPERKRTQPDLSFCQLLERGVSADYTTNSTRMSTANEHWSVPSSSMSELLTSPPVAPRRLGSPLVRTLKRTFQKGKASSLLLA